MVKAQDLRIGNYVRCKVSNDAGVYIVSGIDGWARLFPSKEDKEKYEKESDPNFEPPRNYKAPQYHDERLIRINGGARDNTQYPESKIGGVKLTEQEILNFGFQKIILEDGEECYDIKHFQSYRVFLDPPSFHLHMAIPGNHGEYYPTIMAELKYVHQLQNLYFTLTGEELTI